MLNRAEIFALASVTLLAGLIIAPHLLGTDQKSRQAASLALCRENLRRLGAGFLAYAQDWETLPMSATLTGPHRELVQALGTRYVQDAKLFFCPADSSSASSADLDSSWRNGDIGYFYYSAQSPGADDRLSRALLLESLWPRQLTRNMPADTWVMSDRWYSAVPTAHDQFKKGVNYLLLDGRVDFVEESIRTVFK